MDEAEKFVDGCGGRKVANIDGATGRVVRCSEGCSEGRTRVVVG
jgi:hypothetical protein